MPYATMGHTAIKDLPNLEDIESQGGSGAQMNKYIKNRFVPLKDAGMNPNEHTGVDGPYTRIPYMGTGNHGGNVNINYPHHPPIQHPRSHPYHHKKPYPQDSFTCLDVCSHVEQCPICSKFYKNDKTIYIIIIILLVVICIILLKKVLDI